MPMLWISISTLVRAACVLFPLYTALYATNELLPYHHKIKTCMQMKEERHVLSFVPTQQGAIINISKIEGNQTFL